MEKVQGHIARINFHNPENGYSVVQLHDQHHGIPITLVGNMPQLHIGEKISCSGSWKQHKTFGRRFLVQHLALDDSGPNQQALKFFLLSPLVKGIGHTLTQKILDAFGERAIVTLENAPEAFLSIPGLGKKRLLQLQRAWAYHQGEREVFLFLQNAGIPYALTSLIYKTYGLEGIPLLRRNPYELIRDIPGIRFKDVDRIARHLSIAPADKRRTEAAIQFLLRQKASAGHTCFPMDQLLELLQNGFDLSTDVWAQAIQALNRKGTIHLIPTEKGSSPLLALAAYYQAEIGIARYLDRLQTQSNRQKKERVQEMAADIPSHLSVDQQRALLMAFHEKISIITGGPGTGKRMLIKTILSKAHQNRVKVCLTAPTGRAARQLSTLANYPAQPMHQLFQNLLQKGELSDIHQQTDVQLMIIYEAGMMDTLLFHRFLQVIPSEARLILVGDADQLPGSGAGTLLSDLLSSGKVPFTSLKKVFREAENSRIVQVAHQIKAGVFPTLEVQRESDLLFISREAIPRIQATLKELILNRLPKNYGYHSKRDIQVLSPMKKGPLGTAHLNSMLRSQLNPFSSKVQILGKTLYLHDKVIQTRNHFEKGVLDGEMGWLKQIDRKNEELQVQFGHRRVRYAFSEVDQLDPAYVIPVHKYQGSDCPCVILPLHTTHYTMLYRNLLYTAITRARKRVIIIGTKKAVWIALKNNEAARRYTALPKLL